MMDATKYSVGYYPLPVVEPGHVYEWPQKDHRAGPRHGAV